MPSRAHALQIKLMLTITFKSIYRVCQKKDILNIHIKFEEINIFPQKFGYIEFTIFVVKCQKNHLYSPIIQFYKKSYKTCLLLFNIFVAYNGFIINVVIINIMNIFIFFKCFWSLE